jgi:hypothetical protein
MFDQTMRTATSDQTRSLEAAPQVSVPLPVRGALAAAIKRFRAINWDRAVTGLSSSGPYWHATHQLSTRQDSDLFPWED